MSLSDRILDAVENLLPQVVVQPVRLDTPRQNQFLILLKPECFLRGHHSQARDLIQMILMTLLMFDVEITGTILISGERLREASVMDRHYGYINLMSRSASIELAATGSKLRQLVGAPATAKVLGGHELLSCQPSLDARSLNDLWATKEALRIRSGLYVELHEVNNEALVIVNGFHPKQLEHFTGPRRCTAVLIAQSDLPWQVLRSKMIGDTFPAAASVGSIRRTILERSSEFGFQYVDESNNCIHMSSGPFEALAEIRNFLRATSLIEFDIENYRQVRHLRAAGWRSAVGDLLSNPPIKVGTISASLNDVTEGIDGYSAANLAVSCLREEWERACVNS